MIALFAFLVIGPLSGAAISSDPLDARDALTASGEVIAREGITPSDDDGGFRSDPCDGAIYSQFGRDGRNGSPNQDSAAANYIDAWTVDNVVLTHRVELTGIVVELQTYNNPTVNFADALIAIESAAGGPGPVLLRINDTSDFDLQRATNSQVDVLTVNFPPLRVVPGKLYVGARERIDAKSRSYLLTAAGDGQPGYLKSATLGYSDWISVSEVLGNDYDFSFCLLGRVVSDEFGACCTNNDSTCTLLTADECQTAGGNFLGVNAPCLPSPCGAAKGACCFTAPYGCTDGLTQADCVGQGGSFQGGDVACADIHCAPPDPCDGSHGAVIYSNSVADGEDALSSEDGSDPNRVVSYTADDITLDAAAMIGGFHWYDEHEFASDATGFGDYIVLGDIGMPDDSQQFANVEDVAVQSLDTGEYLFGTKIWQNNISANVSLDAGVYWVGLRLDMVGKARSFWLTAPLKGNEAYLKSEFYGFATWTAWSVLIDTPTDVAFCVTGPSAGCDNVLLGDSNGDGGVDFGDIDCFVAALSGPDNWSACGTALPPDAFTCANDLDHSGIVDFDDIDAFVECLVNGQSPCP